MASPVENPRTLANGVQSPDGRRSSHPTTVLAPPTGRQQLTWRVTCACTATGAYRGAGATPVATRWGASMDARGRPKSVLFHPDTSAETLQFARNPPWQGLAGQDDLAPISAHSTAPRGISVDLRGMSAKARRERKTTTLLRVLIP